MVDTFRKPCRYPPQEDFTVLKSHRLSRQTHVYPNFQALDNWYYLKKSLGNNILFIEQFPNSPTPLESRHKDLKVHIFLVLIRNTVPNQNSQQKTVPNKKRLCKIHKKKDFLLNRLFSYLNLEISLCFRRKKCFQMDGPLTYGG